ncbi:MAG: hypothetical protein HQL94_09745 [Magnetococcales bacterium]|nr:hypothetical protein [Magnetococcales bacterium]
MNSVVRWGVIQWVDAQSTRLSPLKNHQLMAQSQIFHLQGSSAAEDVGDEVACDDEK